MQRPSYVPHYLATFVAVFAIAFLGLIELEVRSVAVDRGFLTTIGTLISVVVTQVLAGLANEQSRKSANADMADKIEHRKE